MGKRSEFTMKEAVAVLTCHLGTSVHDLELERYRRTSEPVDEGRSPAIESWRYRCTKCDRVVQIANYRGDLASPLVAGSEQKGE